MAAQNDIKIGVVNGRIALLFPQGRIREVPQRMLEKSPDQLEVERRLALRPADYWDRSPEERREADRQLGLEYPELPDFKLISTSYLVSDGKPKG